MFKPSYMKSGLRIAFLTSFDPLNKKVMSGVSYYFLKILREQFEVVDIIGPAKTRNLLKGNLNRVLRIIFKRKRYNLDHSFLMSFLYKFEFEHKLKGKQYDFIFALRASTEIALINSKIPVVYYSDATFKLLYNYYDWFSGFLKLSVAEGNKIEQLALRNSSVCLFASEWAIKSAVEQYGCDPEATYLLPFPPNVDHIPEIELTDKSRTTGICNLLFLGVEWERKGGQIALNTYYELKNRGIKCRLTICGCIPPEPIEDEGINVIPYLNKNLEAEYMQFEQMMLNSHFLILPTRAECYGIVFAEASSYAVPSLATQTGGIGSVIKDGINGFRLPLEANGADYADVIETQFSDYTEKYLPLSRSSRKYFDEHISAEAIGKKMVQILENTLSKKQ